MDLPGAGYFYTLAQVGITFAGLCGHPYDLAANAGSEPLESSISGSRSPM